MDQTALRTSRDADSFLRTSRDADSFLRTSRNADLFFFAYFCNIWIKDVDGTHLISVMT